MRWLTVFITGFIFALGLGISGMTQPGKVIGFLDVFGNWDPSLLFVMMGAIGINIILYRLTMRRRGPIFAANFTVPRLRRLSPQLFTGSILFGIGWGLAGYCPGPALVSTASGAGSIFMFIAAMLTGMFLHHLLQYRHEDDDVVGGQSSGNSTGS